MGLKKKSGGAIYNLKIKDQQFPSFELLGKEDGQYIVADTADTYVGRIQDAEVETYEYKGAQKYKLTMQFLDEEGQREKVSANFNYLTLSIINTLASEENLFNKEVELSVYNKNENARVYIEIEGEKASWKFEGEDFQKICKSDSSQWARLFEEHVKPKFKNVGGEIAPNATAANGDPLGDDPFGSFPVVDDAQDIPFDDMPF